PKPYIDEPGTPVQFAVRPARQASHSPQLIWNGTTTRSPGRTVATSSPTVSTSATHSWPRWSGRGNGVAPSAITGSMSHVAIAIGCTIAPRAPGGGGAGELFHLRRAPG